MRRAFCLVALCALAACATKYVELDTSPNAPGPTVAQTEACVQKGGSYEPISSEHIFTCVYPSLSPPPTTP